MEPSDDLKFYTTKEAGAVLHLSPGRVRQFIRDGQLKAFCHLGKFHLKKIFIRHDHLHEFVYQYFLHEYWRGRKRPGGVKQEDGSGVEGIGQ